MNASEESIPYHPIEPNKDTSLGRRSEGTCAICLCAKANQIVIPCGHMCMCADCAHIMENSVYGNDMECPICKGQIMSINRVISS
jgi:hypothetical protein